MDELGQGQGGPMDFEVGADPRGIPMLMLQGELDMATVDRLDDGVAPILARSPSRLIVDVARVSFADSSAIAKLVRWSKAVDELEVRGASPLLRRVIDSMGLTEQLGLT